MEKEYEVWTEGYRASGDSSQAIFHGKFKGKTFREAVVSWVNTLTDEYSIACVDLDNMNFWGCRFFDNGEDARKSFG